MTELMQAMLLAIVNKEYQKIQSIQQANPDVIFQTDTEGNTLLHHAVLGAESVALEIMLEQCLNHLTQQKDSADYQAKAKSLFFWPKETVPLAHLAFEKQNLKILNVLYNHYSHLGSVIDLSGIKPPYIFEVFDKDNNSVLHYACVNDYALALKFAFKYADLRHYFHRNNGGDTPLGVAIKSGSVKCVTLYLESWWFDGRSILKMAFNENTNDTLFHEAAYTGKAEIIGIVLKYASKIQDPKQTNCRRINREYDNKAGLLPVHCAAVKGYVNAIIQISKYNGSFLYASKTGKSVFDLLLDNNHIDELYELISRINNDEDLKEYKRSVNLYLLSEIFLKKLCESYFSSLLCLMTNIIDSSIKDGQAKKDKHFFILKSAISLDNLQMVCHLIDEFSEEYFYSVTKEEEENLLHIAAKNNAYSCAGYFASRFDTAILLKNKNGDTPLHLAIKDNYIDVVANLLSSMRGEKNIDLANVQNQQGETPFYLAVSTGNIEIVEILYKAKIHSVLLTNDRSTLLHAAIKGQSPDILRWLSENGLLIVPSTIKPISLTNCEVGRDDLLELVLEYAIHGISDKELYDTCLNWVKSGHYQILRMKRVEEFLERIDFIGVISLVSAIMSASDNVNKKPEALEFLLNFSACECVESSEIKAFIRDAIDRRSNWENHQDLSMVFVKLQAHLKDQDLYDICYEQFSKRRAIFLKLNGLADRISRFSKNLLEALLQSAIKINNYEAIEVLATMESCKEVVRGNPELMTSVILKGNVDMLKLLVECGDVKVTKSIIDCAINKETILFLKGVMFAQEVDLYGKSLITPSLTLKYFYEDRSLVEEKLKILDDHENLEGSQKIKNKIHSFLDEMSIAENSVTTDMQKRQERAKELEKILEKRSNEACRGELSYNELLEKEANTERNKDLNEEEKKNALAAIAIEIENRLDEVDGNGISLRQLQEEKTDLEDENRKAQHSLQEKFSALEGEFKKIRKDVEKSQKAKIVSKLKDLCVNIYSVSFEPSFFNSAKCFFHSIFSYKQSETFLKEINDYLYNIVHKETVSLDRLLGENQYHVHCLSYILKKFQNERLDIGSDRETILMHALFTLSDFKPLHQRPYADETLGKNYAFYQQNIGDIITDYENKVRGLAKLSYEKKKEMCRVLQGFKHLVEEEDMIVQYAETRSLYFWGDGAILLHTDHVPFRGTLRQLIENFFGAFEQSERKGRLVDFCQLMTGSGCIESRSRAAFDSAYRSIALEKLTDMFNKTYHETFYPYWLIMLSSAKEEPYFEEAYEFMKELLLDQECLEDERYAPKGIITEEGLRMCLEEMGLEKIPSVPSKANSR